MSKADATNFQSPRYVTYYRVSTARQGASGLGLEAQRSAVQRHLAAMPGKIVAEYVEVESGKRDDRPQLALALATCRLHRATLVLAKLDRLARNVRFISELMDSETELIIADLPFANRLTLHLLAAIAEHEGAVISERTKAALAAAKARGTRLGNPNGAMHLRDVSKQAARQSVLARQRRALDHAKSVLPLIEAMRHQGICRIADQARELNRLGVPAPRGGVWQGGQVRRIIKLTNM